MCTSCRCSGNSTFSPGHLHGQQGCFFRVFCTSLRHVLHFYMRVIAGNFFVHILQMLWQFHIFPGSFIRTPGFFWGGFPHIPETSTAFLHVCDSWQSICAHPADAPEIPHFSQVIYTDIRVVFFGFSAHPRDMYCILHVCGIFIQDIYPPNYLCTSCIYSESFAFV